MSGHLLRGMNDPGTSRELARARLQKNLRNLAEPTRMEYTASIEAPSLRSLRFAGTRRSDTALARS